MKFFDDGFVAKVAYGSILKERKEIHIPSKVSMCKLAWRFVTMLLVGWLLQLLAGGIIALLFGIFFGIAGAVAFFIASYPHLHNNGELEFQHYKRWPKIRGHQIYPLSILLPVAFIWLAVNYPAIAISIGYCVAVIALIILAAFLVCMCVEWREKRGQRPPSSKPGPVRLAVEYLKAKKQKVCPIVEFVPRNAVTKENV